eukprot:CAMPEP_0184665072 /NCGR_PEP_ID=MMETSP0308-20130426/55499_1 /TAXON_ID=38269 /ORGANISM="Gloeochaete witrockiana, Strain SAG 46.84" /LENGTH=1691 /DNA_ID=CAMNT_0027108833 /DNA_START=39 /DNA_END=5111 /DNA_ORIENTATION=-
MASKNKSGAESMSSDSDTESSGKSSTSDEESSSGESATSYTSTDFEITPKALKRKVAKAFGKPIRHAADRKTYYAAFELDGHLYTLHSFCQVHAGEDLLGVAQIDEIWTEGNLVMAKTHWFFRKKQAVDHNGKPFKSDYENEVYYSEWADQNDVRYIERPCMVHVLQEKEKPPKEAFSRTHFICKKWYHDNDRETRFLSKEDITGFKSRAEAAAALFNTPDHTHDITVNMCRTPSLSRGPSSSADASKPKPAGEKKKQVAPLPPGFAKRPKESKDKDDRGRGSSSSSAPVPDEDLDMDGPLKKKKRKEPLSTEEERAGKKRKEKEDGIPMKQNGDEKGRGEERKIKKEKSHSAQKEERKKEGLGEVKSFKVEKDGKKARAEETDGQRAVKVEEASPTKKEKMADGEKKRQSSGEGVGRGGDDKGKGGVAMPRTSSVNVSWEGKKATDPDVKDSSGGASMQRTSSATLPSAKREGQVVGQGSASASENGGVSMKRTPVATLPNSKADGSVSGEGSSAVPRTGSSVLSPKANAEASLQRAASLNGTVLPRTGSGLPEGIISEERDGGANDSGGASIQRTVSKPQVARLPPGLKKKAPPTAPVPPEAPSAQPPASNNVASTSASASIQKEPLSSSSPLSKPSTEPLSSTQTTKSTAHSLTKERSTAVPTSTAHPSDINMAEGSDKQSTPPSASVQTPELLPKGDSSASWGNSSPDLVSIHSDQNHKAKKPKLDHSPSEPLPAPVPAPADMETDGAIPKDKEGGKGGAKAPIVQLREELVAAFEKNDYGSTLGFLKQLEKVEMTLEMMKESMLCKWIIVNRSSIVPSIAEQCRVINRKWRKLEPVEEHHKQALRVVRESERAAKKAAQPQPTSDPSLQTTVHGDAVAPSVKDMVDPIEKTVPASRQSDSMSRDNATLEERVDSRGRTSFMGNDSSSPRENANLADKASAAPRSFPSGAGRRDSYKAKAAAIGNQIEARLSSASLGEPVPVSRVSAKVLQEKQGNGVPARAPSPSPSSSSGSKPSSYVARPPKETPSSDDAPLRPTKKTSDDVPLRTSSSAKTKASLDKIILSDDSDDSSSKATSSRAPPLSNRRSSSPFLEEFKHSKSKGKGVLSESDEDRPQAGKDKFATAKHKRKFKSSRSTGPLSSSSSSLSAKAGAGDGSNNPLSRHEYMAVYDSDTKSDDDANDGELEDNSEDYCFKCEDGGELLICDGPCKRAWHIACLGLDDVPSEDRWLCDECKGGMVSCFFCKSTAEVGPRIQKCSVRSCSRLYHPRCRPKMMDYNERENGARTIYVLFAGRGAARVTCCPPIADTFGAYAAQLPSIGSAENRELSHFRIAGCTVQAVRTYPGTNLSKTKCAAQTAHQRSSSPPPAHAPVFGAVLQSFAKATQPLKKQALYHGVVKAISPAALSKSELEAQIEKQKRYIQRPPRSRTVVTIEIPDPVAYGSRPITKRSTGEDNFKKVTRGRAAGSTLPCSVATGPDSGSWFGFGGGEGSSYNRMLQYLAPVLHRRKYTSFGRHHTQKHIIEQTIEPLAAHIEDGNGWHLIDSSAGENIFAPLLAARCPGLTFTSYDIVPAKNQDCFLLKSFFDADRTDLPPSAASKKIILGYNPPFGVNGDLAIKFANHGATKFRPQLIGFIVPSTVSPPAGYRHLYKNADITSGEAFFVPGSVSPYKDHTEPIAIHPEDAVFFIW